MYAKVTHRAGALVIFQEKVKQNAKQRHLSLSESSASRQFEEI